MRIHIGKSAPKGFVELPGAVHMGKGVWMMRVAPEDEADPMLAMLAKLKRLAPRKKKTGTEPTTK